MERIFKDGIFTTCIGVVLMGAGVYMYLSKEYTALEAGEAIGFGLIFLRSKDSLIGLKVG